jgi:hypothetical protein
MCRRLEGPIDLLTGSVKTTARIHAPSTEKVDEKRFEMAAAGMRLVRHLVECEEALFRGIQAQGR